MNALSQLDATAHSPSQQWSPGQESPRRHRRSAFSLLTLWRSLTRSRPERRYERRILKRIKRGELTNTLGVQVRDESHIRDMGDRWLATLVQLGLRPDDVCVEYGCGSLWCAEPVIRHLHQGRFVGLDVTDAFYELGRQRLGDVLIEKHVKLSVISRRSLRAVAALKPHFVYSHRVLHHVPPRALARYMRNLVSLLSERTILVIENTRPTPDGSFKRRYSAADIQAHLPKSWECRQETFGLLIVHRIHQRG